MLLDETASEGIELIRKAILAIPVAKGLQISITTYKFGIKVILEDYRHEEYRSSNLIKVSEFQLTRLQSDPKHIFNFKSAIKFSLLDHT